MLKVFLALLAVCGAAAPAFATSGPGCLYVVNVAADDVLNMRGEPSASSPIVDRLPPTGHGIIHLDDVCVPLSRPWGSRWCPVTHYNGDSDNGDSVTSGWVKARFVRDSECP